MIMDSIDQLIDANIVDAVEFIAEVKFSEANILTKSLEMELGRVRIMRDEIHSKMESSIDSMDSEEYDNLSREFVKTYVIEGKILDRIDLCKKTMERKGIKM